MAIERRLTEIVGPLGGKLHTGALAQRPGRDRRGAVRARRTRRGAERAAGALMERAASSWPSATATGRCPATRTCSAPSPSTSAHHLLAYFWMLAARRAALRSSRVGATASCRSAPARWPGVNWDIDRGAVAARARLRRGRRRTRSTRSPTATSCSTTSPPRRPARCTSRGSAPRSCSGRARSSASASSPTRSPRARASCRRRRTPTRPSCCAPRRRGSPRASSTLHGVMHGAAAHLQQGPAGGQGAAVRRGRHARALPRGGRAGCSAGSSFDRERLAAAAADEMLAATDVADLLVRKGVPFREAHGDRRRAGPRGARAAASRSPSSTPRGAAPPLGAARRRATTRCCAPEPWLESKVSEGGTALGAASREQLERGARGARGGDEPAAPLSAARRRLLRPLGARGRARPGRLRAAVDGRRRGDRRDRGYDATSPPATPTSG